MDFSDSCEGVLSGTDEGTGIRSSFLHGRESRRGFLPDLVEEEEPPGPH